MSKTIIVIVNGKPRAGKDQLIEYVEDRLKSLNIPSDSFSSIQPVKDMMANIGIDVTKKTPEDRKLLADIGDSLELHSNYKSYKCIETVNNWNQKRELNNVFFLHIREKKMIDYIQEYYSNIDDISIMKVLVTSPRQVDKSSNSADANVNDILYDYTIDNNKDLSHLDNLAGDFVTTLFLPYGGKYNYN